MLNSFNPDDKILNRKNQFKIIKTKLSYLYRYTTDDTEYIAKYSLIRDDFSP